MGGLAKSVPTTRRSLGFSMMASKNLGICSEKTSMTSRGFCSAHQTQSQHHHSLTQLFTITDRTCAVRPTGNRDERWKKMHEGTFHTTTASQSCPQI